MSTVRRTLDGSPTSVGRMSNERCTHVRRTLEMAFCIAVYHAAGVAKSLLPAAGLRTIVENSSFVRNDNTISFIGKLAQPKKEKYISTTR